MKYLILPILFVFAALTTNAQLSADNYDLKTQNANVFGSSNSTSQLDDDAQGDDFNKKRRKSKKKSSPLGYGVIAGGGLFTVSGDDTEGVDMKFGMQFGLIGTYQLTDMFGV